MEPGKLKEHINRLFLSKNKDVTPLLVYIIKKYLSDKQRTYSTRFELENFSSKDMECLLSLLEDSQKPVRKMALFILSLVLTNPLSKIFFLEKCGLSLIIGKTFITRLKFLSTFGNDNQSAERNTASIIYKLKSSPVTSSDVLFWYIPLDVHQNKMNKKFKPRLFEFKISEVFTCGNKFSCIKIPDPVYNLCGIEFTNSDFQIKINTHIEPENIMYTHSTISHTRKSTNKKKKKSLINNSRREPIKDIYMKEWNKSTHSTHSTFQNSNQESNFITPLQKKITSRISNQEQVSKRWKNTRQARNIVQGFSGMSGMGMPLKNSKIANPQKEGKRNTRVKNINPYMSNNEQRGQLTNRRKNSNQNERRRTTYNFGNEIISSMHDIVDSKSISKSPGIYHSGFHGKHKNDFEKYIGKSKERKSNPRVQ